MILTALPQTQPRRPMFRLAAIGVLAGCLSLATGCGITPDDTPRAFPSDLTDPVPVPPVLPHSTAVPVPTPIGAMTTGPVVGTMARRIK